MNREMRAPVGEPYPSVDWDDFSLQLVYFYEGRPIGVRDGLSAGPMLTLWRVSKGLVLIRHQTREFRARPGEWMMAQPGERHQRFSDDAQITSIHFVIHSSRHLLQWKGTYAVVMPTTPSIEAALQQLRRIVHRWKLRPVGEERRLRYCLPLPGFLQAQQSALAFFGCLLDRAKSRGLWLDAAQGDDERVSRSLRQLATRQLDIPFSRRDLARAHGLSPGSLDRLWLRDLGVTPFQYWEKRRMEWCIRQLGGGHLLIKEVAASLGFSNLSRFSFWFRHRNGRSPREFRRLSVT